jgi:hypothetical protein
VDLNGVYYSSSTYNGHPDYYNNFNKENVSINIWRSKDVTYPRNNEFAYWIITYREATNSGWGDYNYIYYSSQETFTPDLVSEWGRYDEDWSLPTISVESSTDGFNIDSFDYDDTYIHLTVTKDATKSISTSDMVYIKDAMFMNLLCREDTLHVKFEESYAVVLVQDNEDDSDKLDISLMHFKGPIHEFGSGTEPYQCGATYITGGKLIVV